MTFSVEIANISELLDKKHHVEIYIDPASLKSLIARLDMLAERKEGEHLHLMTESWGLGDLTETPHTPDNVITHHLKIILSK